jgi:hypothetical protein
VVLNQPLASAKNGTSVEMVYDLSFTGLSPSQDLVLDIDRGNIGGTDVTVFNYLGNAPVPIASKTWSEVTTGLNSFQMHVATAMLTSQP